MPSVEYEPSHGRPAVDEPGLGRQAEADALAAEAPEVAAQLRSGEGALLFRGSTAAVVARSLNRWNCYIFAREGFADGCAESDAVLVLWAEDLKSVARLAEGVREAATRARAEGDAETFAALEPLVADPVRTYADALRQDEGDPDEDGVWHAYNELFDRKQALVLWRAVPDGATARPDPELPHEYARWKEITEPITRAWPDLVEPPKLSLQRSACDAVPRGTSPRRSVVQVRGGGRRGRRCSRQRKAASRASPDDDGSDGEPAGRVGRAGTSAQTRSRHRGWQ